MSILRVCALRSALVRPCASHVRRSWAAGPQMGTLSRRPRSASSSAVTPSSPARARRLRSSERKALEPVVSTGSPGQLMALIIEARTESSSAPARRTGGGNGSGRLVSEVVRIVRARAAGVRTRTTPSPWPSRSRWAARPRSQSARVRVGASRTASRPPATASASSLRARDVLPVPGAPRTTTLDPSATRSRTRCPSASAAGSSGASGGGRRWTGSWDMGPSHHGSPTGTRTVKGSSPTTVPSAPGNRRVACPRGAKRRGAGGNRTSGVPGRL